VFFFYLKMQSLFIMSRCDDNYYCEKWKS